jgi:hypothetical protein
MKRTLLCLVAVFSLGLSLAGQQMVEQGMPSFGAVDSHEYDSVDLMSNDVMLDVPIMKKDGFLPVRATWHGNFFFTIYTGGGCTVTPCWQPSVTDHSQLLGPNQPQTFGVTSFSGPYATFGSFVISGICSGLNQTKFSGWFVQTADGAQHPLVGGTAAYTLWQAANPACTTNTSMAHRRWYRVHSVCYRTNRQLHHQQGRERV